MKIDNMESSEKPFSGLDMKNQTETDRDSTKLGKQLGENVEIGEMEFFNETGANHCFDNELIWRDY